MVVVCKLCEREPIAPVGLSMIDKDPEVFFDLLIYSFSLSVGLWMEGHGRVRGDVEHSVEFLHELGDELWASVRDDDLRHSMLGVDMVSEDSGPSFS